MRASDRLEETVFNFEYGSRIDTDKGLKRSKSKQMALSENSRNGLKTLVKSQVIFL